MYCTNSQSVFLALELHCGYSSYIVRMGQIAEDKYTHWDFWS